MTTRSQFNLFYMLYIFGYGICCGTTYMVPVKLGWKAFPRQPGLISGIIIGGYGVGPLIFAQISSAIVNPDNEVLT
jgi:MFS family permease